MEYYNEWKIHPLFQKPRSSASKLLNFSQTRRILLKRGRILGKRVIRYFTFQKEDLVYYKSQHTSKIRGRINLNKAFAIPHLSKLSSLPFAAKVTILTPFRTFFLHTKSEKEFKIMMNYLKLASNGSLQEEIQLEIDPPKISIPSVHSPEASEIQNYEQSFKSNFSEFNFEDCEEGHVEVIPSSGFFARPPKLSRAKASIVPEISENMISTIQRHFSVSFPTFSERKTEPEYLRKKGVEYMWNFQLDEAKNCFEEIKSNDIRAALHYAEIFLLRVIVTGRKIDVINSYEALKVVENQIEYRKEPYSDIIEAETNLLKSILMFVSGHKLKVFFQFRKVWKTLRKYENWLENVEDDDIKARVYLGLGFFLLIVQILPRPLATIFKLAGFSSNKEKALEYLNKSSSLKASRSPFAIIMISLYYIDIEPDLDYANEIIEDILFQYPRCVLLYWIKSVIAWKLNQMPTAINILKKALSFCGPELSHKASFIKYELGWFYFLKLDWNQAKFEFEEILEETLSLSSELDELVKEMLQKGHLTRKEEEKLNDLYEKPPKKKQKTNWIEDLNPNHLEDRVYIPHKACLIIELAGCEAVLREVEVDFWLKVTKIASHSQTKTKLDIEFGQLAEIFLIRESKQFLAIEVIYFLKEHTKLLPDMLNTIVNNAQKAIGRMKSPRSLEQHSLVEFVSARMLHIMALCLNGDTDQAVLFVEEIQEVLPKVPKWASYLVPHTLYWCGRAYFAELESSKALESLYRANKMKNYLFNIREKINRVISEIKSSKQD